MQAKLGDMLGAVVPAFDSVETGRVSRALPISCAENKLPRRS